MAKVGCKVGEKPCPTLGRGLGPCRLTGGDFPPGKPSLAPDKSATAPNQGSHPLSGTGLPPMTSDHSPNTIKRKPSGVSVLMYHQIGEFPSPRIHRASFCHVKRFKAHMAWLKTAGYHVIPLRDARMGLFEDKILPPRCVVLTFDDGCDNFRQHALPVLSRHGYPSAVFLVSDMLGRTTEWMTDMDFQSPLMDRQAVLDIHARGDVTFGSHTMNHARLTNCDDNTARREVFDSKKQLEDMLGSEVADFCYPYGSYDQRIRDMVEEAGYLTGLTCIRGMAEGAMNAYEIPRKAVSYGDSVPGLWWKLIRRN